MCGKPVTQAGRKGFTTEHRFGQAGQGHAHFSRLFNDDFQKTGGADVTRRLQFGHGLHLLLGLAGATREHGATQGMGTGFHHRAGRNKVVTEAVVDQVPRAKPGGKNRARHAPIVAGGAFRLVNGAGAGEHARHVNAKARRAEATKHVAAFVAAAQLPLQQFVLADHRQFGQGLTTRDIFRVHIFENLGKRRRGKLGMGQLHWQGCQKRGFTLSRRAGFQRIKGFTHATYLLFQQISLQSTGVKAKRATDSETPRSRLRRAAGVAPGKGESGHTKWASRGGAKPASACGACSS